MKKLAFVLAASFIASASFTQVVMIPGTKYPFYSDIITFTDGTDDKVAGLGGVWEIVPLNKNIKWNPSPIPLNEKLVQQNLLKSLNHWLTIHKKNDRFKLRNVRIRSFL